MSDPLVAKASTYTGQHNTETQRQTSMPRAGFKPMIPVTKRSRPMPKATQPPGPVNSLYDELFSTKFMNLDLFYGKYEVLL
jgi:hypothetical protein